MFLISRDFDKLSTTPTFFFQKQESVVNVKRKYIQFISREDDRKCIKIYLNIISSRQTSDHADDN